ncbi:hypothetical protein BH23BAC3_BH23BAC3_00350 [soil metagenome]
MEHFSALLLRNLYYPIPFGFFPDAVTRVKYFNQ